MTGLGEFTINCINDEHNLNKSIKYEAPSSSLFRASVISLRLCPEQKTFPFAASTITLIELSLEAILIASFSLVIIICDKAFLFI